MTDGTGAVVWSADYKPFGEATITVSMITNNLRFPGQYYDTETGLNYNYFRDYNPVIGRYAEADPLLLQLVYKGKSYFVPPYYTKIPTKLHDYIYVRNNPVNKYDPLGLQYVPDTPGAPLPGTENMNLDEEFENWVNAIADAAFYVYCEAACHLGMGPAMKVKTLLGHIAKDACISLGCGALCDKALEKIREKRDELRAERRRERYRQDRGED